MICRTCRTHLFSRLTPVVPSKTTTTTALASRCATPFLSQSRRAYSTPASDSASSSSPSNPADADADATASTPKSISSVPGGTPLTGLNYLKSRQDIIAGDDAEYPAWLWGLLTATKKKGVQGQDVDTSTMNRVKRKRHEKRLAARIAAQPKTIPLHEQALDITPAGAANGVSNHLDVAAEGMKTTGAITKSAREARRKAIKEDNFLRGM